MKTRTIIPTSFLLTLLFSFILLSVKSQENVNTIDTRPAHQLYTSIGFGTYSHLNLNYESPHAKVRFYAMLSYKHGIALTSRKTTGSGFFCGYFMGYKENRLKKGPGGGLGISIAPVNTNGIKKALYTEYRRVTAEEFEFDSGCYSGSNESDWEEYNIKNHEISLLLRLSKIGKDNWNKYLTLGYGISFNETSYTFEGTFSRPRPSNRVSNHIRQLIRLDFGIEIPLIQPKKAKANSK